jgi:putative glutamine amidotransferase
MKNLNKIILLALVSVFILTSCSKEPLTIVLSKGSGGKSYENYSKWLEKYDDNVNIIDMYSVDNPEEVMNNADALVLTGGPDVHPGRFDKPYETDRCSIDEGRDSLEFKLLQVALLKKMPILGICRGQQLINVALGGSLIIDIPADMPNAVTHQIDKGDAMHKVMLEDGSLIKDLAGVDEAVVNSNHHQAVDKLSKELKPTGYTADGIIEAYEWRDVSFKSWLMAVQWHPERLKSGHPLSAPLAESFIDAAYKYREKVKVKAK